MKKGLFSLLFLVCALLFSNQASAQCDTVASVCAKHLAGKFISDGQQYRALLLNTEETAEFRTTFFGNTTYRIAACSGMSDGNLTFYVYDKDRHLLFTNSEYKNAPYWDFKVNSTLDCIIEAKLSSTSTGSGCAVLLIGFRQ